MKRKLLGITIIAVIAVLFTVGLVKADSTITANLSPDHYTITVGQSITFTCTYTSSINPSGKGQLLISGPETDPSSSDAWDTWSTLHYWDSGTGTKHSGFLTSGVPVTYTQQFTSVGYYKLHWQCVDSGSTDYGNGAYVELIVQVVNTPSVLPEAPPLAVFALSFAAIGLFVIVTKKRTKQSKVSL